MDLVSPPQFFLANVCNVGETKYYFIICKIHNFPPCNFLFQGTHKSRHFVYKCAKKHKHQMRGSTKQKGESRNTYCCAQ